LQVRARRGELYGSDMSSAGIWKQCRPAHRHIQETMYVCAPVVRRRSDGLVAQRASFAELEDVLPPTPTKFIDGALRSPHPPQGLDGDVSSASLAMRPARHSHCAARWLSTTIAHASVGG
jgi:hypothetical protein